MHLNFIQSTSNKVFQLNFSTPLVQLLELFDGGGVLYGQIEVAQVLVKPGKGPVLDPGAGLFFRIILQCSQSRGKMLLWNAHLLKYSRKRHFWFFSKVFIEHYMFLHIFVVKVTNCLEIELFTRRNFAKDPALLNIFLLLLCQSDSLMSLRSQRTEHAKRRQQQRLIRLARGSRKQKNGDPKVT